MALSAPQKRTKIHTRTIVYQGFEREDGLFDIEGHLVDTKTYGFPNKDRGEIKAGEPIHNLFLRLSVDETFEIKDVEAAMEDTPFDFCSNIEPAFKVLIGETIGPGWNRKVRDKLGGVKGCTHLVEMLGPLATAAFQTIYPVLSRRTRKPGERPKDQPSQINGCHVMDSAGNFMKERWPDHYKPR